MGAGFLGAAYLWVKAAHIIFVIFWMAGLFMLPRFLVYHMAEPVGTEGDRRWIEREARGRQTERRRLAAHPRLHQRAAAAPLGLLGRHGHREGLGGDPGRVHGDASRLDEHRVIILVGPRDLPFQRLRQFGLLAARQFQDVALAGGDQIVGREGGDGGPAAHDEADHALGLHRVEAEVARQRGDRGARAFQRRDGVALDRAPEAGDADPAPEVTTR